MSSWLHSLALLSLLCVCWSQPIDPRCSPMLQESDERVHELCRALETIRKVSSIMENYLDRQQEQLMVNPGAMVERPMLGVKRNEEKDVDHVFLRFGKRTLNF